MKKCLFILLILTIIVFGQEVNAIQNVNSNPLISSISSTEPKIIKQDFEQRLNLTAKQKEKAKAIHKKGAQQMKPLIQQIETLKKDIENTKKSNLDKKIKEEKINKDFEEIKNIEKKANEIRRKNSQEFEKILNKKQKKELEKMKAEGREKFEKEHRLKAPFRMFPPKEKPLFPPPFPIPIISK